MCRKWIILVFFKKLFWETILKIYFENSILFFIFKIVLKTIFKIVLKTILPNTVYTYIYTSRDGDPGGAEGAIAPPIIILGGRRYAFAPPIIWELTKNIHSSPPQ
jgi:hypothetical protein